jgi:hypothetical protein
MLFVVSGVVYVVSGFWRAEMGENGRAKRRTQLYGFDVSIIKRHAGFSEHQSHIHLSIITLVLLRRATRTTPDQRACGGAP